MAIGDLFGNLTGGFSFGGLFGLIFVIAIGVLAILIAGGIFWYFNNKKKWNIKKVNFILPREVQFLKEGNTLDVNDIKATITKEYGKGSYDAKRGVVFLKRKGKRKIPVKPFNVSEYLDGSGNFASEIITLNGIFYVNTVATNIQYIEHITVLTTGSSTANVGVLTLITGANGIGTIIGTVSIGDNQSLWGHHYITTGKTCAITGISCGHNGTTVGSGALFTLNSKSLSFSNAPQIQVSDFVRLYGQSSTFSRIYSSPIKIIGPALITTYITPETSGTTIYRSAFDFFEA